MTNDAAVAITRNLPAPIDIVYAMWISTDTVLPPSEALEINAEVGGIYKLIMPGNFCMTGYFSRVELGKRLTYSWQWQDDDEKTTVDVQFTAAGDHTQVTLTHSGFLSEDSRARHNEGWRNYLDGFKGLITNQTR